MRTPNASQWNIGCVGSPGIGACVGHVDFMMFVSISFALGSQHKCSFQWNMGFTLCQFLDYMYIYWFTPQQLFKVWLSSLDKEGTCQGLVLYLLYQ